jgi:predicted RNA-binding protein with PUA-like domain
VLFYHSSAEPPGVAGIARVASAPYPDPTQFDPSAEHFDPRSTREAPTWWQVDVEAVAALPRFVALAELRADPALAGLLVLAPGQRLSLMPVEEAHFRRVAELGGADPDRLAALAARAPRGRARPGG